MIKRLILKKFGKFTDDVLDFAPITIVSGPNEAGKTTVFDALFDTLCRPPGNTREGRKLRSRYGENRQADIVFDGAQINFEVSEFMNLHAIRAGDINIEMSDQSGWMERVRSSLFFGGIDPNPIKVNLENLASINETRRHNRERKQLESDLDKTKHQLDSLKAQRYSILQNEEQVARLKENSQRMERSLREKEQELGDLKKQLYIEEKIRTRKELDGILEFLDEGEKIENDITSLNAYRDDETEELDKLQRDTAKLESDQRLKEAAIDSSRTDTEKMENQINDLIEKEENTRAISELAASINEKINAFRSDPPTISTISWNKKLLISGVVALLCGIAVAAVIENSLVRVFLVALGFALFAILGLLAKTPKVAVDKEGRQRFFEDLVSEWRNSTLDDNRAQWQTLEEFQETLLSKKNAYGELKEKLDRINNERNVKLQNFQNEKNDLRRFKQKLQNSVKGEKEWLETRGIANRDEYQVNLTRRRDLTQQREQWKSRLVAFLREKNLEKTQELRRFCDRKLRELDEEVIPNTGRSEPEIVFLKRSVDDKSREKEDISNKLQELREEIREKGGVIRGSLGPIPDQIIQEELQIKKYDEMIENNLLEREAAKLAGEIFSAVAQDSDVALVELGKSLSQEFEEIIANSGQVTVSHLDTSSILITDAGGTERSLEDLSSGTMNSFLFAARLALAKLATAGKSLLTLDEPFTSFDKNRLDNALAMLKKFYDENGWQIIVLTKDEFLVELIKEHFPEEKVKEHRLGI